MSGITVTNSQSAVLRPLGVGVERKIYEVVQELPTENIKNSVIYLVPIEGAIGNDLYDGWLYVDGEWDSLSGSIDLSDYYTKEEANARYLVEGTPKTNLNGARVTNLQESEDFCLLGQLMINSSNEIYICVSKTAIPNSELFSYTFDRVEKAINCVDSLTSQPDASKYPSALAVYNALQNKQGTISVVSALSKYGGDYVVGELYIYENGIYRYRGTNYDIILGSYNVFNRISGGFYRDFSEPRNTFQNLECPYRQGDIFAKIRNSNNSGILKLYRCTSLYEHASYNTYYCDVTWTEIPLNYYSKNEINSLLLAKENISNKVTTLSSESTDTQYPSAKSVYDAVKDKADKATSLSGYGITDAYTKTETNDKLTYKANIYDPVDVVPNVSSAYDFGAEYTSPEIPIGSSLKVPSEGDYVYNTNHFDLWICTVVSTNFVQNTYHFTLKLLARGGKDINNVYTKTEIDTMIGDIESLLAEV